MIDVIHWSSHTFSQCRGSMCSGWNFIIVFVGGPLGGYGLARLLLWVFIDRKRKRIAQ